MTQWAVQTEASFRATSEDFESLSTFRRWAFDCAIGCDRLYKGRSCLWLHTHLQVLGFSVGIGLMMARQEGKNA